MFTARFGLGPGPVMFDKVCHDNGIKHLLTAPYSPTTTGKIERLHKTIRAEFLTVHDRQHDTVDDVQAALDAWVVDVPRQELGRILGSGKVGVAGSARAWWTSAGRFQDSASCGLTVLNSTRKASASRTRSVASSICAR